MELISSRQLHQASAAQSDGWTIKDQSGHAKHIERLRSHHIYIPLAKESLVVKSSMDRVINIFDTVKGKNSYVVS